jgi:hypothetical protein
MKAEIATKQAKFALLRLHAELGGKIIDNRKEAERLRRAMVHIEAVLKLLGPALALIQFPFAGESSIRGSSVERF